MISIRDILAEKGGQVVTISAQESVHAAAVLMDARKIGSLMVMQEGCLIGLLTEREILQQVVVEQRDANSTRVDEVMSTDVACCRPHTSLEEARSVMKNRRIRHLPVVAESGEVIGIISIGDLNAYQVDSQERTICQLQEYIYGYV
jgi:CBS domain-containing protein